MMASKKQRFMRCFFDAETVCRGYVADDHFFSGRAMVSRMEVSAITFFIL